VAAGKREVPAMTGPEVGGRRREEGETDREEDPGAPPECSKGRREAVGQNWPRGAVVEGLFGGSLVVLVRVEKGLKRVNKGATMDVCILCTYHVFCIVYIMYIMYLCISVYIESSEPSQQSYSATV
jgi:hypothetical protein